MARAYVVEWSADCNSDGVVDLGQILAGAFTDINRDGEVNGSDLGILLASWGTCGN